MPRSLPQGLKELLSVGTGWAETHSTLALETRAGNFWLATTQLTIDDVRYSPDLRETGELKQSLTSAVDRVDVQIQNVDLMFGLKFVAAVDALHGARAVVGRYWRDLRNGAEYHKGLLSGVVVSAPGNEQAVTLTIVSELYASRSIGGRLVARNCQWRFKSPSCGYSGVLQSCNKLLQSADGCQGRARQFRYGGFIYIS